MAFPELQWPDWCGFAGAVLMLLALFLQATGSAGARRRGLLVLHLLGALALLPALLERSIAPLFFLLVGWILVSGYGLLRKGES